MLDSPQPAARVHVRALLTPMTDDELIAYARGWLDGYDRGELHTMTDPPDPEEWRATVQRWRTVSERALARLMWDRAVKAGDDPTPYEHEELSPWNESSSSS